MSITTKRMCKFSISCHQVKSPESIKTTISPDTLRSLVPALRDGTRSKSTSSGDASKWTSSCTTNAPKAPYIHSFNLSTSSSSSDNTYETSSLSEASSTIASFWHTSNTPSSTPFLLPECHIVLRRNNFVIVYDQSKRIPVFAAETLTKDSLRGNMGKAKRYNIPNIGISSVEIREMGEMQGSNSKEITVWLR